MDKNNCEKAAKSASLSKTKFCKSVFVGCMAAFMGLLTILCGCAPTQNNNKIVDTVTGGVVETTSGLGLDPKNDPVVYTTESGLEIKMSNADKFSGTVTTTTNTGYTYTQDLSSFYYFTMGTFSGTIYTGKTQNDTYKVTNEPVNWIILGVGSHTNAFVESVSNYLFSTIKNNDYLFSNGEYYFDNQHETFSPAGQLIDSVVNSKTYIMGKVKESIKVHTEIPKGCMLVLSEKLLGQMYFNSSGNINAYLKTEFSYSYYLATYSSTTSNCYGNRYRYMGDKHTNTAGAQTWDNKTDGSLYSYINGLFSKNTSGTILKNGLGFTQAQANLIVPQQLYTNYSNGTGYPLTETPATDGGNYYTMFPLASYDAEFEDSHVQSFELEDYLTKTSQLYATLIGSNQTYWWWARTGRILTCERAANITPEGGYSSYSFVNASYGVRPAMVMKLA